MEKTSTGLDENIASLLCYVGWWVTGIIFLLLEKENKVVRFHAWQSIFAFGAITIISIVIGVIPIIGQVVGALLWILGVVLWIIAMVKAYQSQKFMMPIVGNLAEKQASQ